MNRSSAPDPSTPASASRDDTVDVYRFAPIGQPEQEFCPRCIVGQIDGQAPTDNPEPKLDYLAPMVGVDRQEPDSFTAAEFPVLVRYPRAERDALRDPDDGADRRCPECRTPLHPDGVRPTATVEITREQLEGWAGRILTDADVADLDELIPLSSIPAAVNEIVAGMDAQND